jgi:tetratricopeptide (TPR) repeat protein
MMPAAMGQTPRRLAVLGLVSALAGCATTGRAPSLTREPTTPPGGAPPAEIAYAPHTIEVSRLDLELVGKNEEELFAIGQAAFSAGDYARAANAFGRLADRFPSSAREATALYDAGLAHQRLEQWRAALGRFRTVERKYDGPDAVEAAFRVAECHYHLEELAEARAVLDRLARRTDLPVAEHIRALTQRGVVELEAGQAEEAEKSLRLAVSAWKEGSDQERLDDYYPAQAQFYLGEVFREHFQAVKLDPSRADEARLGQDLEDKAALLLSAQGHYLRAIRIGNADWAVAAGFRIGELYDAFHAALVGAPLPTGLDEEHADAYRTELRRKVRILVTKAIAIYEQTLATAGRIRIDDNRFVAQTQASLDRMKRELVENTPAPSAGAQP